MCIRENRQRSTIYSQAGLRIEPYNSMYSGIAFLLTSLYHFIVGKARFEWDEVKNRQNQLEHGISFDRAQYAFGDPDRVIAEDIGHSQADKLYYCVGRV